MIAIDPKRSAGGHSRAKECAPTKKPNAQFGGPFGGQFLAATFDIFLELTGSDARFPSVVRQIDVIGLCYVLICNQEVAGSIPVRSTATITLISRVSSNS